MENFHGDNIAEGRVDFQIVFTVSGDQEEGKRLKEEELLSFALLSPGKWL